MSAADENAISPAPRRTSTRWKRPLWIGLAIVIPIIIAVVILASVKPPVPHFPYAALCVSDADGKEMARAGLQDPQSPHVLIPGALTLSMQPKRFKFVDKDKGMKIQIDWRLLRSSTAADTYEFKITTGLNVIPTVKRIDVSTQTVELMRAGGVVVTIKEKAFDRTPTIAVVDE